MMLPKASTRPKKVIFNHWLKDLFGSKTQIELFYSMNLDSLNRPKSVAPVCATLMVLPRSNGWRVLEHICWGQRDKIIVVRSLPIAIDRTVNRAPRKCVEPRCWFIVRVSIYFYDHRINLTEDGHVFWLCPTPPPFWENGEVGYLPTSRLSGGSGMVVIFYLIKRLN